MTAKTKMEKDPLIYTDRIFDRIRDVEIDTEGYNFETFDKSQVVKRAVECYLEVISKASRKIPDTLKEEEKEIPWKKIAGLENALGHSYGKIDYKILWDICKDDLPPLKEAMLRMQQKLEGKR